VVFTITATVVVVKLLRSHREKMARLQGPVQGSSLLDERLARVEQTVESIAIEIERVSEGQRFVTKLLSARARAIPEGRSEERVITPH
jgi:aspartate 1-decarboxylase